MDCDFDAPMFVDFQNLDGDHQERQEAEAYFEVDHESDIHQQLGAEQIIDASASNVECDTGRDQRNNWEPQIPASVETTNNEERFLNDNKIGAAVIVGEKSKNPSKVEAIKNMSHALSVDATDSSSEVRFR